VNFSTKTKRQIVRQLKSPTQDLYPDRSATDLTVKGDSVYRLPFDEVPRTTYDVSMAMKWRHKDGKLYGTHVNNDIAIQDYVNDINTAWGKEDTVKYYFINTFTPNISFYDQFIEMKRVGR